MVKLLHGDCLELMKGIESGSVDLILTDPPYGTTDCKWDSVIPFKPMWEHLNRVVKKNGAICLFGSEPFSSSLRISNIKNYKYDWIWVKDTCTGFMHAKNCPMKKHENISVFSLGKVNHKNLTNNRMVYYPQGLVKIQPHHVIQIRSNDSYIHPCKSHLKGYTRKYSNYPNSVLFFDSVKKTIHQTQKPVTLLRYFIKTYTIKGDTVLDFTMGSGSTGVACIQEDRNFIGIEKDDNYFKIAQDRIKKAQTDKEGITCLQLGI